VNIFVSLVKMVAAWLRAFILFQHDDEPLRAKYDHPWSGSLEVCRL
jgi:hypothetical protein